MASKAVLSCAKAIAAKQWNIFFTESATAGRMCAEFALSPVSGKILRGGISCYEVFIKEQFLNIPHQLIKDCTPESQEVTRALAENSARLFSADITVAVTGLTTEGGSESPQKPVGTMFIHIVMPGKSISHREVFSGGPETIILKTIDRTAELIIAALGK
jgi:nicotinamide-nucleotide amidase